MAHTMRVGREPDQSLARVQPQHGPRAHANEWQRDLRAHSRSPLGWPPIRVRRGAARLVVRAGRSTVRSQDITRSQRTPAALRRCRRTGP